MSLPDLSADLGSGESPLANLLGRCAPRGWYSLEQLSYCRLFQLQTDGATDVREKRISPRRIAANAQALERELDGRRPLSTLCLRHQLLAVLLLPELSKLPLKCGRGQVTIDEAVLACALERYRLANQDFPETLAALVPGFISRLPHDPFTGEAYRYRRTTDGQFILYSVGWNERDDGGVSEKTWFDETEGDWGWQYPAR